MTSLDVASLHDIAALAGEYTNTASSKRHGFKAEGNREGKKEWMSAGLSHKYGYCNSHGFLFVFFQIFLATRGWLWYTRSDGGQNGKPKP
jgi:hypothetical protein